MHPISARSRFESGSDYQIHKWDDRTKAAAIQIAYQNLVRSSPRFYSNDIGKEAAKILNAMEEELKYHRS